MPPTIGLYFDLRNPEPWRRDPTRYYGWHLDLVEDADRRGLGAVWVTEHHFVDDGYLSQPLTMLAAFAGRTSQVRLGTAVVLAPLRAAVQIAEEAALVDLVSGGRLELGLGAGYVRPEFEAFDAEMATRYGTTDRRLREVAELLGSGPVTPSPVQDPVPLWAGYLGPRGATRAGRLGVGLLTVDRDRYADYERGLTEGGHATATARMGGLLPFVVADDPEAAFERILPHRTHQLNSYREQAALGSGRRARRLTDEEVRSQGSGVIQPLEVVAPEVAVERIRAASAGLPVTHVFLWASIGGMPEDLVERQVELLVDEVIPAFGSTPGSG